MKAKILNNSAFLYIVPFFFKEEYDEVCKTIDDNCAWEKLDKAHGLNTDSTKTETDTYEYLKEAFCRDYEPYSNNENMAIGRVWKKDLEQPFTYQFKVDQAVRIIDSSIKNVGLFIFRNRVGFLWYNVELKSEDVLLEDLIKLQNDFKELARDTRAKGMPEDINKRLGVWVDNHLKQVFQEDSYFYFADRNCTSLKRQIPDKAILFNYIIEKDGDENDIIDTAYYLTTGFNRNYLYADTVKEDMLQAYKGVYWYATKEGAGFYLDYTTNPSEFLKGLFKNKFLQDYFLMYVLLLHQEYSLILYAKKISRLSSDYRDYYNVSQQDTELDELVTEINTFFMKSVYTSVSHVHHQNLFYEYIQERLGIEKDINSINMGLNSVVKIQRLRAEKMENEIEKKERSRQEKDDKRLNFVLGFVSIFAITSAISDGFATVEYICDPKKRILTNVENATQLIWAWIVFGVVILISVIVIVYVGKYFWKNRKTLFNRFDEE